jgi:hypothetical protein
MAAASPAAPAADLSMSRLLARAAAPALAGAVIGAGCFVAAHARQPEIVLEMDRDVPALVSGVYPVERSGDFTFAWTGERAEIRLPGLDRRQAWSCEIRLRGARPTPALPQPDVTIVADGVRAASVRAGNELADVLVAAPARPGQSGLTIGLEASTTFVPGGGDGRRLGLQLDRLACRPAEDAFVRPPRGSAGRIALASAILGGALALLGLSGLAAVAWLTLVAVGQAVVVAAGVGEYSQLAATAVPLAAWIGTGSLAVVRLTEARLHRRLTSCAAAAVAASISLLYLQLLALFHPDKPLVDALFHAHRLEWVLAGRLYFTQLSTSATPFPYAIGLYLVAAPWSWLTRDYVALLRIVVTVSRAAAGLLLYWAIVRSWGDRLAAAVAVALAGLVPLSYQILGNANLTHAFGSAVSLATVAAVVALADRADRGWVPVVWALLATLGFVSHIAAFVLLLSTLAAIAALYVGLGGPPLRRAGLAVLAATGGAMLLSVVLYWGHFGPVYAQQLARARDAVARSAAGAAGALRRPAPPTDAAGAPAALGRRELTLARRATDAFDQTRRNIGWPILVLALVGLWWLPAGAGRDRLGLVLGGWGLTGVVFLAAAVLGPGNVRYQQDAWEFIGRVQDATAPAAVVLAAVGASRAWRAGAVTRALAGLLLAAALAAGARAWLAWLP